MLLLIVCVAVLLCLSGLVRGDAGCCLWIVAFVVLCLGRLILNG